MKKAFALLLFFTAAALPLSAQNSAFGLLAGGGQSASGDFEISFSDPVRELFWETGIEEGTAFKVRAGRVEADFAGAGDAPANVDYINALIEYRFYEIFGSTSLFAGPGYYRQENGELDESNWGVSAGVNALFPVTRRFGLMAEAGYHFVNFEERLRFVTLTGGIRFAF